MGGLLATQEKTATGEKVQFNHSDQLGVRVVTDPAAGTSFEQATLPFGTPLGSESTGETNRRFTNYDRSASNGLDYATNRFYDSSQGRFTQVDPIGMASSSLMKPQSLNLYAYCENDPINHSDPDGLDGTQTYNYSGIGLGGLGSGSGTYSIPSGWSNFLTGLFGSLFGRGNRNGIINLGPINFVNMQSATATFGLPGMETSKTIEPLLFQDTPTPCETMAARAQTIANDVVRSTIRNNPADTPTYSTALPHFDFNFNTHYTGHITDGSVASIDYFLSTNGGRSNAARNELGQQDFRAVFLDSEFARNDVGRRADQTHHFAFYFSGGINLATFSTYYQDVSDTSIGRSVKRLNVRSANTGDLALGVAAYDLGRRLRKDPSLLSKIGDLIRNEICGN